MWQLWTEQSLSVYDGILTGLSVLSQEEREGKSEKIYLRGFLEDKLIAWIWFLENLDKAYSHQNKWKIFMTNRRSYFFFFVTEASSVIVRSLIVDEFFQCPWAVAEFWTIFPFFTSLCSETTSASNASIYWLLSSNFFWSDSSMHLCSSTSIFRPWTCSSRVLERIFSALISFISLIASS